MRTSKALNHLALLSSLLLSISPGAASEVCEPCWTAINGWNQCIASETPKAALSPLPTVDAAVQAVDNCSLWLYRMGLEWKQYALSQKSTRRTDFLKEMLEEREDTRKGIATQINQLRKEAGRPD